MAEYTTAPNLDAGELSFEALRPRDGAPPSGALAYWVGTLAREGRSPVRDEGWAGVLAKTMASQFDAEEQSAVTGRILFAEEDEIWSYFQPLAPIQLVEAWSPLPAAIDAIGPPTWWSLAREGDAAAVAGFAWSRDDLAPRKFRPAKGATTDEKRFGSLFQMAASQAVELKRGLVLLAKPGWSCGEPKPLDATTRARMRRAGYLITDRRANAPPPKSK